MKEPLVLTSSLMPRKEKQHMRSHSLPNIIPLVGPGANHSAAGLLASDIFTDRMGMIDLNYHDTQKIVRDLLEHRSASNLHSVNERMSEESLEDSHAFNDITSIVTAGHKIRCLSELSSSTTTGHRASATMMMSTTLEPLEESEEGEEDEFPPVPVAPASTTTAAAGANDDAATPPLRSSTTPEAPTLSPASRLFPNTRRKLNLNNGLNGNNGINGSNSRSRYHQMQRHPRAVSMPNIYANPLHDDADGSKKTRSSDLLTDNMGLHDLEYGDFNKIVEEVLHHKTLPSLAEGNGDNNVNDEQVADVTKVAAGHKTRCLNEFVTEVAEAAEEEDEEEEEKQQEEDDTPEQQEVEVEVEVEVPKAKKGIFARFKGRSSLKKSLRNP
eukprot:CAMPEP_0113619850 /NCGR_PEP_ID=MMETSP0017_2-20120614/10093_1 /TAXON_ID=2856 /ORGANISM="Cylindrotheca closterium" /LENGTH=383 /DNA_ID=CAMNT_0000529459 /DNA_START=616 /DNA_END=1767 /DNA_ORIENTATION=+ /assembly_acc=CAM_ASM_000147